MGFIEIMQDAFKVFMRPESYKNNQREKFKRFSAEGPT